MQKNKVGSLSYIIYKNTQNCPDLNIRAKITELSRKTGVNLCAHGLGNGFLDMTPKAQATKEKWDLIKINSFCVAKNTIKKVKKITHRIGENTCKSFI